jgi:hypothetical protein
LIISSIEALELGKSINGNGEIREIGQYKVIDFLISDLSLSEWDVLELHWLLGVGVNLHFRRLHELDERQVILIPTHLEFTRGLNLFILAIKGISFLVAFELLN